MCLKFACFGYVHYDDDDGDSRVAAPRARGSSSPTPYWQQKHAAGYDDGGHGQPQRHGQGVVHYYGNDDGRRAATTRDNGYGLRQQAAYRYPPAPPDGTWKRPARSYYDDGKGRGGRYYSEMGRY